MTRHAVDPNPEAPLYLRFGEWPENEHSRNFATGDVELGVSVYDLAPDGSIVVPEGELALSDLRRRLTQGEPAMLVQGDWVGTGGDGEALLQNVRCVGFWPKDVPSYINSAVQNLEDQDYLSLEEAIALFQGTDAPMSMK